MRQALPMDSRIWMKGIQIVSKCHCCTASDEETIAYLFMHSQIAREVWRCFGVVFGLPSNFASNGQLIKIWFPKVGVLSQLVHPPRKPASRIQVHILGIMGI